MPADLSPPPTREALLTRAEALAGRPLAHVADRLGVATPSDLRREKGWTGLLLERALGATAGSRAEPDFPALGVELKTLPVDDAGAPRESSWVCVAPLDGSMARSWQDSWVRRKLSCVLWIPVIGGGPLPRRRLGAPLLWTPAPDEAETLREDWELLSGLIRAGELSSIDASLGAALQIRPKAANGQARIRALDADGRWVQVTPRGFYLRRGFTHQMLTRRFVMPRR